LWFKQTDTTVRSVIGYKCHRPLTAVGDMSDKLPRIFTESDLCCLSQLGLNGEISGVYYTEHGEGRMRGWRLDYVNCMRENLFQGSWWREVSLARYRGTR